MRAPGYWDSVATEWQQERYDPVWRKHADAVNLGLVTKWVAAHPGQRLLKTDLFDEAVGDGLYATLKSRAGMVIGMDLSQVTAAVARRRNAPPTVTCTDVRALPFPDASFDCIVSNSTLDHFPLRKDLLVALRELHRVLRPSGTLLLTLDNLANPVVALRNALPFRLLNRLGLVPYYVGASCGPWRLRRVLDLVGFECREMAAVLHTPRLPSVWAARVMHRVASAAVQQRFLNWLLRFEFLGALPTRYLTGYFVAARAVRRAEGP